MPEFVLDGVAVAATPGESVLAACQRVGVILQTVCKGRGICGACRVEVDPAFLSLLEPPAKNEARLLNYLSPGETTYRLGCQIKLEDELAGLRLKAVPLAVKAST
jgi:ferredoxin, 2Fe-2S